MHRLNTQTGSVNPLLISSIVLGVFAAGLAGFGIWSFSNYTDQKNNTDAKIAAAVEVSKKAQESVLEKQFIEREKQPYEVFNGPDDLGSVSFNYPKTWSVYVAKDGSTGTFEAYLNPGVVPTVSNTQPFATRVVIDSKSYEETLRSYESLVKKGTLKSSPITVNGFSGVRLDGTFSPSRQGSSVVFKVRDKSLIISSDAVAFKADFDSVIVTSLDFNP